MFTWKKGCKDSIESSSIVSILHYHGTCPNQDASIDTLLLAKLQILYLNITSFPICIFWFQDPVQGAKLHLLSHLGLLWAVTVSVFPCFSWPWQFWGVLVRHFVECYSVWICPVFFFSWLYWGRGLGERILDFCQEGVKCPCWYIAVKGLVMPPWRQGEVNLHH